MSPRLRRNLRRLFIAMNMIVALMYLLVCLVPWLASGSYWIIAMMGIGFPFLFILLVIFLLCWSVKRSKWAFLSLIVLLAGWQQVSVMAAWRVKDEFSMDKEESTLRVLSWNVSRWDEMNREARGGMSFRNLMIDYVQMQNADVLCFQEFFECYQPPRYEPNIPAITKMGYPYHYFFPSAKIHEGTLQFGLCIFSRYPIIDSAAFLNGARVHAEGFAYVDIKKEASIFRVYTTHLESVGFSKQDYEGLGKLDGSRTVVGKIRKSYTYRNEQAKSLRDHINGSPYPSIVCGDVDDIPNSYAYFSLRGDMQDAFLKKGSGLGRTFKAISPTLRIDYLFADKAFNVVQFESSRLPYSDHYPLLVDLTLPKNP